MLEHVDINKDTWTQYKMLSPKEKIEFLYSIMTPDSIMELSETKTEFVQHDEETVFLLEEDGFIIVSGYKKKKVKETIQSLIMEGFILLKANDEEKAYYMDLYPEYMLPEVLVMKTVYDTEHPISIN